MLHSTSKGRERRQRIPKSSPHSTEPTRLKRNVRFSGRRTTIVLEPYVWDSIDAILVREDIGLDEFCETVNKARVHSSLASASRIVVLAYFRILDGLHFPPFSMPQDELADQLKEPNKGFGAFSVLPLAIRRFAQDEARD